MNLPDPGGSQRQLHSLEQPCRNTADQLRNDPESCLKLVGLDLMSDGSVTK
jgi:hypothetical protein